MFQRRQVLYVLRGVLQNIYFLDRLKGVKIINKGKFELFYDHSKKTFETYELYKKPGVLNKIIAFLVTSALFISIFQFYLKLNKVLFSKLLKSVITEGRP